MILRRLILLGALVGGLVVSAAAMVSALVFTLHTVFERWLGPPGAWAALFGLLAVVLGAAALIARLMSKGRSRTRANAAGEVPLMELVDRFAEMVRERPVAAISTAVGAGVLAVRDPTRLASAIRRFAAGEDQG